MDFITGIPPTIFKKQRVDAILVIVDRFTKYCLFYPVSTTMNSAELAELFHTEVELRYGPPDGIVSDRGSVFTSKFWSKLCFISKIKLRLSTAFHPQTDGQTERMNQVIEQYLRNFVNKEQTNWPTLLQTAQFACNNAQSATTGVSPHYALLGWNPDFHIRAVGSAQSREVPEATARVDKLAQIRAELQEHWRNTTESQTKHYNETHKKLELPRNSLVALSTKNLRLKIPSRKLAPRFIGPFRIIDKVGQQAYRLTLPQEYDRIHNVFHISLLEPWHERPRNSTKPASFPLADDDQEWEIEEVKDEEVFDDETHFLVKWKDWPSEYNQWIPKSGMENAQKAIQDYKKRKKQKTMS